MGNPEKATHHSATGLWAEAQQELMDAARITDEFGVYENTRNSAILVKITNTCFD